MNVRFSCGPSFGTSNSSGSLPLSRGSVTVMYSAVRPLPGLPVFETVIVYVTLDFEIRSITALSDAIIHLVSSRLQ